MTAPMTMSSVLELEMETMRRMGCSKEEMLRTAIQRYNQIQDMKWFGKKYLNEEEIVAKAKKENKL